MDQAGSRQYPDKPTKVYLFGTCLIDLFCPEAGIDAVQLLEREGIEVHFPADQTCCAQPAHSSGFPEQTRAVALAQLRLFPEPWPVIVPSGSCAGMMRQHYPEVFADDPGLQAEATALAERIFELSEFLVHVARVKLADRGAPTRIALHTSCAARREMGTHLHARSLLAQLPGVEVAMHEHESECCGFGGTFSLKHPAISSAMAGDKVDALQETGAQKFVSADCGCMLSLNHTLQKRGEGFQGQHLASFLWQRTGGEGGQR
ncbi:MAG: (Fe-S)-binding protein [Rhodobacteraceae bacterium]|uniref:(Fe-S)-binding protein n=1 Tax=Accumulibacter sp. TaxID=2053492 RepID=UPI0019FF6059|nr:(Fe-S)-binding protein [Accumulibacter sp.]MBE2261071.1 (Fe-S)-binding protein [Paracoccaceae bacterium]